ncbi:MAG: TPM domain-containing protein [Betaproteobacteria bacterium]
MSLGLKRLTRLLRHRWLDETDTRRALGPQALARIEQRIAASERQHTGEIRVCVEPGLPLSYLWRGAHARERAIAMFGKLRVWDTEANNGVLIYLLLAEHQIEIVADRGIARHVPPGHWESIVHGMREAFRAGRFEPGLMQAIEAVEALMLQHFPQVEGQGNPDELPNRPYLA